MDPTASSLVRLIAMYLPQFHPIPENDAWWGAGFTEWTNVAKARPQFAGHDQPHLPGELGFYDLRLPETRAAQAELAADHGIDGFCYYHYWFNGRRLLERPFAEVLSQGEPPLPFCLCWANENWTRTWDGGDDEVLIAQHYSEEDDRNHIRSLLPAFSDDRYIRFDGRPLFLVYRASLLPDPARTADVWREEAARAGVGEIFLCRVESFGGDLGRPPSAIGFDAGMRFTPDWTALGPARRHGRMWGATRRLGLTERGFGRHAVYDYDDAVGRMAASPDPEYRRFPSVTPSWDNSPRRARGAVILQDSSPERYRTWLEDALRHEHARATESLVFVNAWNEWGEGNHLEPSRRWGRAYLEATRDARDAARRG